MKWWNDLSKFKKVLVVVVVAIILIAALGGGSTSQNDNEQESANTEQQAQASDDVSNSEPEESAVEEVSFAFDDGTHVVGEDIQPGTYRTHGDDGSALGCYWERLAGFSGEFDEILANSNRGHGEPEVVTIKETDKGFKTEGCGKWYKELTQVTENKQSFGSGTFIVGTDIEPGNYKNSGAEALGCYWERRSGFSGEFNELIANDNVETTTLVTISPTDKAFTSHGCGTWTKQ